MRISTRHESFWKTSEAGVSAVALDDPEDGTVVTERPVSPAPRLDQVPGGQQQVRPYGDALAGELDFDALHG